MVEIATQFINVRTDFGFKLLFGSEKHKHLLIRFLNALFDGRLKVNDVRFHDKEILPSEEEGKRIVYDVYCTVPLKRSESSFFPASQVRDGKGDEGTDHHFILEMQNFYNPPFEERLVFYVSRMVSEQGRTGWNYELAPVFAVAVTDFNLGFMKPKLVRDIMLVDRESGEPLTDKLHIFMCSLKEVSAEWSDCRTELEEILFLIKNLDNMDSTSTAYREGRYREFFEAARTNRLTEDEIVTYSQSLDKLRETQAGIRYAAEQAAEKAAAKARAEGRAEGKAEGIAEGIAEGMRIMLSLGIPKDIIAQKFGITVEEVSIAVGTEA